MPIREEDMPLLQRIALHVSLLDARAGMLFAAHGLPAVLRYIDDVLLPGIPDVHAPDPARVRPATDRERRTLLGGQRDTLAGLLAEAQRTLDEEPCGLAGSTA